MHQFELELTVGETVQLEEYSLTVIDICGEEITFRIDHPEPQSKYPPTEEIVLSLPGK